MFKRATVLGNVNNSFANPDQKSLSSSCIFIKLPQIKIGNDTVRQHRKLWHTQGTPVVAHPIKNRGMSMTVAG